jgi:hypothetical protein
VYQGLSRITDVRWTPKVNMLIVTCGRCDAVFEHRADRWVSTCPSCNKQVHINKLRERWCRAMA